MLFLILINVCFNLFFFSTNNLFILAGDVWICKPSGLNQGKGIYLVRDIEGLKSKFAEIDAMDKKKQISIKPMKRVHY
jgi:phosphoribosylamine-glycine ligase